MPQHASFDEEQWSCPLCSSLQLLVFQKDGSRVSLSEGSHTAHVRQQAERSMKEWVTNNLYDMKWSWKPEEDALLFESVDLEGSAAIFPRRFLDAFVGRQRNLVGMGQLDQQPWTWVLSTISTK